jgi:hypothetical protein
MCEILILSHIWDAFGFLRKNECDNAALYHTSARVDSASGNGTEVLPPEATPGPSVWAGGGFHKIAIVRTPHIDALYMPLASERRHIRYCLDLDRDYKY